MTLIDTFIHEVTGVIHKFKICTCLIFLGINEPDVNDKEENTQQPLPKEDKIPQGTYNLDFLDDLSSVNPFETKSKINTSAEATDDFSNVNPFETKSKINTSIEATESSSKAETDETKNDVKLALDLVSESKDAHESMVSPVDLPNLEEIPISKSTINSSNEIISQDQMIEANQSNNEQKDNFSLSGLEKPTSINLNQKSSPRRKISTPDFEEEERLMMMDELTPTKNNASFKFEPFKLDWNSPVPNAEDNSTKLSTDQPNVTEPDLADKETIKSSTDVISKMATNKPLIFSSPSEKSSPSVFSPLPSSTHSQNQHSQNDSEMHVHWDEFDTSKENKTISTELSTSKKDDFVRMELHYQATLLDKDKELHDKEKQIQHLDQEVTMFKLEIEKLEFNNKGMLNVVTEYEKTISEVIADRERERVCDEIAKEKLRKEKDQTLDDLHSAERAFNDVHRYNSH